MIIFKKTSFVLIAFVFFVSCKEDKNQSSKELNNENTNYDNIFDTLLLNKPDSLWGGIRSEILDSVYTIEGNFLYSRFVGIKGETPKSYHTRKWLYRNGTVDEFKKLKTYPVTVVRLMAFEALFYKLKDERFELLLEISQDTNSFFYYQTGCIANPYLMSEYFFEHILTFGYYKEKGFDEQIAKQFTKEEFLELMKIYTEIKLNRDEYFRNSDLYFKFEIPK